MVDNPKLTLCGADIEEIYNLTMTDLRELRARAHQALKQPRITREQANGLLYFYAQASPLNGAYLPRFIKRLRELGIDVIEPPEARRG